MPQSAQKMVIKKWDYKSYSDIPEFIPYKPKKYYSLYSYNNIWKF